MRRGRARPRSYNTNPRAPCRPWSTAVPTFARALRLTVGPPPRPRAEARNLPSRLRRWIAVHARWPRPAAEAAPRLICERRAERDLLLRRVVALDDEADLTDDWRGDFGLERG